MSSEGSRSDGESSEEGNVFLELGSDPSIKHFCLDETLSTPLRRVFKFQNLEGAHETLGLADIMTMIRGSPTEFLPQLKCVYLAIQDGSGRLGALGKSEAKERDPRVIGITEWTHKIPLPLGGDVYTSLRIVFHLRGEIPDSHFKMCADVVPVPRQFLESADNSGTRPKMKRFLSWGHAQPSTLRLQGGTIISLENPKNALEEHLPDMGQDVTFTITTIAPKSASAHHAVSEVAARQTDHSSTRQLYCWSEVVKKLY